MKTIFSILTIAFFCVTSFAQESRLSATLSYPIPFGDNFFKPRTGIFDLGLQYHFANAKVVRPGLTFNGTLLGSRNGAVDYTNLIFVLAPR